MVSEYAEEDCTAYPKLHALLPFEPRGRFDFGFVHFGSVHLGAIDFASIDLGLLHA